MFDAAVDNLLDVDDVWEPSAADIAEYLSLWSADAGDIPDPADVVPDALSMALSLRRLSSAAQAQELEAIAAFARETLRTGARDLGFKGSEISEYVLDEISCALSITRRAADVRLTLALQLTESLPGTLAAWKAGDLDGSRVNVIAD